MRKKLRILPLAALAVVAAAMWLGAPMMSGATGSGTNQSNSNGTQNGGQNQGNHGLPQGENKDEVDDVNEPGENVDEAGGDEAND